MMKLRASMVHCLLLAACAKPGTAPTPEPGSSASVEAFAGHVERVEGAATAQRAVSPTMRSLLVNAPVWADDTVTTGPEASIAIRLLHNGALWQLEGGQVRRVDAALAWNAPRQVAQAPMADKQAPATTAAAGRHSEQEAADSAEAALRPQPVPVPIAHKNPRKAQPTGPSYHATTNYDFPDDTVEGDLLRPIEPPATPIEIHSGAAPGGKIMGAVSHEAALAFLRKVNAAVMPCYRQVIQTQPDVAGKLVLSVTLDAKGKVSLVQVAPTTLPEALVACAKSRVERLRDTHVRGVTLSAPLVFRPRD
jgi:hypothetical protein